MELMDFPTIDTSNSKSVGSTTSKFARKKDIGVTVEKTQKNEISKIWSWWLLPNDGSILYINQKLHR